MSSPESTDGLIPMDSRWAAYLSTESVREPIDGPYADRDVDHAAASLGKQVTLRAAHRFSVEPSRTDRCFWERMRF